MVCFLSVMITGVLYTLWYLYPYFTGVDLANTATATAAATVSNTSTVNMGDADLEQGVTMFRDDPLVQTDTDLPPAYDDDDYSNSNAPATASLSRDASAPAPATSFPLDMKIQND
ncbi:hypothetical protein C6P42_001691 [Pichia californica]|nr:hypothetical protein C6P42_001691 [[Candida] californica]